MAHLRGLVIPLFAATALLISTAGCSDGDASTAGTATETVTVTVSPSVAAATGSPSATSSPSEAAVSGALGDVLEVPFGTIQVLDYRQSVLAEDPAMNGLGYDRFDAIEAKTCVAKDYADEPVTLSWYPWSLADADGGTYPFLDVTGPTFIPPVYPQSGDRTTRAGQCSRGWIVFGTTKGAVITEAAYESDLVDQPLVWSIGS